MKNWNTELAVGALAALSIASIGGTADAASSKESEYIHPACEGTSPKCGAIAMINGGAYTLDWVSLKARGTQPYEALMHEKCKSVSKKFDRNTPGGNYDVFVVPASCAYKLELKILSGNKKDLNLYLTPGCQIKAQVSGTVTSNSWKGLDVAPLSDEVPTDKNGSPINAGPYKCGKQSAADNAKMS